MRRIALLALAITASAAAPRSAGAQPGRLALGPPPSPGYTDDLYPIGWSDDGERLAYLVRATGGGATGSRYILRVQDLTTDQLVADEMLTSNEPDGEPRLRDVWAQQQRRIRVALQRHGIRSAAVRLIRLPHRAGGGPYSASVATRRIPEGIAAFTVTMRNGRGQTKAVGSETSGDYSRPTSVRVLGALRAPTGDRLAVIVEVAEPGFEAEGWRHYRLYGARIGAQF